MNDFAASSKNPRLLLSKTKHFIKLFDYLGNLIVLIINPTQQNKFETSKYVFRRCLTEYNSTIA